METKPQFLDVTEESYHADSLGIDCGPTLSASIAKIIVAESPLHAWSRHPKLGAVVGEATDASDRGTLIHALLLGAGREVVKVDAKDWRTNAAKDARAAARKAGKLPVLAGKLDDASEVADMLRRRLETKGVVLDGVSEQTIVWRSDGVACRGRIDHLRATRLPPIDLKTCESAHPDAIRRSMETFGYDIQGAAYEEATGEAPWFVFMECEPPYAVTVVEFRGSMAELGRRRWARAVRTWKRCLVADEWPDYADKPITVDASEWAIGKEALRDVENV